MRQSIILLSVFVLFKIPGWTQQSTSGSKSSYSPIPVTESRRVNPVKPTPESIDQGKRIYGYECAGCHGATGDGKTEAGKTLKIPNLTDASFFKDRPDGELSYVIKSGRGDMPPEGDRLKEEEIWDLVNYVRSLAKSAPSDTKPIK